MKTVVIDSPQQRLDGTQRLQRQRENTTQHNGRKKTTPKLEKDILQLNKT